MNLINWSINVHCRPFNIAAVFQCYFIINEILKDSRAFFLNASPLSISCVDSMQRFIFLKFSPYLLFHFQILN